ncbi:hypothetical protein BD626DRAFT_492472, partial [Schizophyllum amplum]
MMFSPVDISGHLPVPKDRVVMTDELRLRLIRFTLHLASSSAPYPLYEDDQERDVRSALLEILRRLVTDPSARYWKAGIDHIFRLHNGLQTLCQLMPIAFDDRVHGSAFDDLAVIVHWYLDASVRSLHAERHATRCHYGVDCPPCQRLFILQSFDDVDTLSWILWIDGRLYNMRQEHSQPHADTGILRILSRLEGVPIEAPPPWPVSSSPLDEPLPWLGA